jgi:hypothetical protein
MARQAAAVLVGQMLVGGLLIFQQVVRARVDLMAVLGMLIVEVSPFLPQLVVAVGDLQL